jgi:hypothetical protein
MQHIMERRTTVRRILDAAAVSSADEGCHWVSAEWLQQWADAVDEPGPIDNSLLLCPHGKLDLAKAQGGILGLRCSFPSRRSRKPKPTLHAGYLPRFSFLTNGFVSVFFGGGWGSGLTPNFGKGIVGGLLKCFWNGNVQRSCISWC